MKLLRWMLSTCAVLALSSGVAVAHDDAYFDAIKSPHGGQTRMAGVYHFELVLVADSKTAKENTVVVYVTDHAGKAISTKGASANLVLVQGANKVSVNLIPDTDNRLVGRASYASAANLKGALTVTMENKPAEQARFTPFAKAKISKPKKEEAGEHAHHH